MGVKVYFTRWRDCELYWKCHRSRLRDGGCVDASSPGNWNTCELISAEEMCRFKKVMITTLPLCNSAGCTLSHNNFARDNVTSFSSETTG